MDHRVDILRAVPGLFGIPPAELAALARAFRLVDVLDATLCVEGGAADALFILAEGRCAVSRRTASGAEVGVAELTAGCVFGHLALLRPGPRVATVRTRGPARLLVLSLDDAHDLLRNGPLHVTSALRRALIVATSRQLTAATQATATLARGAGLCDPDPRAPAQPIPVLQESEILVVDPRW